MEKEDIIIISGKKEGNGGIEEFATIKTPNISTDQWNLYSAPTSKPKRELLACLNIPAPEKSPIEAHP
jgi:hypothetical protein